MRGGDRGRGYMNEGGVRGGSTIGPTGSPSRLVSTSSGDGSPYDMLEQEELLYTENYPGKLCALCNLSERSTLGQGDIVRLRISLSHISLSDIASSSNDATDPEDPNNANRR